MKYVFINIFIKNRRHPLNLWFFIISASLCAQERPSDTLPQKDDNLIEEIVISASRNKRSVSELSGSVTLISQEKIEKQSYINTDITQTLQYLVPGLAPNNSGRTLQIGNTLRGRRALILIDGVPQSTPMRYTMADVRSVDPLILEKIEVIKGATAIYGNGADGGIINYITKSKAASKTLSGTSSFALTSQPLSLNSSTGYRIAQTLGGTHKKWQYLFMGAFETTGILTDAQGVRIGNTFSMSQVRSYSVFTKIHYAINQQQNITMAYNLYGYQSFLNDSTIQGDKYARPPRPTISIPNPEKYPYLHPGTPFNHNATLQYHNAALFKNTELNINLYWQQFLHIQRHYKVFFAGGGQPVLQSGKAGLRLNFLSKILEKPSIKWELLYGTDLLGEQFRSYLTDGRLRTPALDMTNLAPYVLSQWQLSEKKNLFLHMGYRFEHLKLRFPDFKVVQFVHPDGSIIPGAGGVDMPGATLNYTAFVGSFGLRYNPLKSLNAYAHFSQSFSIPEVGRYLAVHKTRDATLSAIIVNNYEIGLTGRWGPLLHYEIAGYISTSELGATQGTRDGRPFIARNPEIVWGYEINLSSRPVSFLSLSGAFSYVEGKATNQNTYLNSLRIMPPKLTLSVESHLLKNRLNIGLYTMWSFARIRFQPIIVAGNQRYNYGEDPIPAYHLLNLNILYRIDARFHIALGIDNLLNADYYPPSSVFHTEGDPKRAVDPTLNEYFTKGVGLRTRITLSYQF